MGLLLKLGNLFVRKPLEIMNRFLNGKKTYIAGIVIALPALACLVQKALDLAPLDLNDLMHLLRSDCVKNLGEALAIIGFRSAMTKNIPRLE